MRERDLREREREGERMRSHIDLIDVDEAHYDVADGMSWMGR